MPEIGLTEASKLTGKSPSTITRAANAGRVSSRKNDKGQRVFDVSELERVFGPLHAESARTSANVVQSTNLHGAPDATHEREMETLKERLDELKGERRREREQLEETITDLRKDRDHWRDQADRITLLLSDQRTQEEKLREALRQKEEAAAEEEAEPPRSPTPGFWARLLGRA